MRYVRSFMQPMLGLLGLLLAHSAPATLLSADRNDLAVSGSIDLKGGGAAPGARLFYGVFLLHGFEAGPEVLWTGYSGNDLIAGGLHVERTTELNRSVLPYLGAGVLYGQAKGDIEDTNGLMIQGEAGIKIIFSESLALSLSLAGYKSNENLYGPDDDPQRTAVCLQAGLRFFL